MSTRLDRAWVLRRSGKRLDLLDPHPMAWDDADLATGLSRTYRWCGHSKWDLPLSVAQHSITVLLLSIAAAPRPLTAGERLRELMHDAEEGLLGYDALSVLKPHLGEGYRRVTERLTQAVAHRYRLPDWTAETHAAHKRADQRATIKDALALLRLAVSPDDRQSDEAFRRVCNTPARGLGPKALGIIETEADWRGVSLLRAVETAPLTPKVSTAV